MARIGILGGTFDPPHIGHIIIAKAAKKELQLSRVIFIPARLQPHKIARITAPPADRSNMLSLAIEDEESFEISDIELLRVGPSFTVDTLEELNKGRPDDELFLIIGADNVPEIETWYNPDRIFELATVAAANRPDYASSGRFEHDVVYFKMPPTNVSSTEIRRRIRAGESITGMVSPKVENYIQENGLYK